MRRNGRRLVAAVVAVGFSVATSPRAWAQDPIHKASRGVVNVLTSWVEWPKQIYAGTQDAHPLRGIGRGIVKGSELAVARIGIGAFEVVTCLLPFPHHYRSPYETLALPDYAWE